MKLLCLMLMLVFFALSASAQALLDPSARPNVTVIEKTWRMEVRNPKLEKDQLKAMAERENERHQRIENERINQKLREQGMPTHERPPVPKPDTTPRVSIEFIYELKVKNTGKKGIRTLTWDYVFFEPGTEREVGRRRFSSKVGIRPGKTRHLVMYSRFPPTGTIDASKDGKLTRDLYSEQIVIQSIEYADGSVWQAASN